MGYGYQKLQVSMNPISQRSPTQSFFGLWQACVLFSSHCNKLCSLMDDC